MTTAATPDYFSASFWRTSINNMIFGAATNSLTAWTLGGIGSTEAGSHLSVPGVAVGAAALTGAIFALILSLLGQALPGTGPAQFVPLPAAPHTRPQPARTAAKKKAPPVKRTPPPAAG